MIQIDDAGSGSLVGGTCIGLYHDKTDVFSYEFIPLDLFTPENFQKKVYQDRVIDIFNNFCAKLHISSDEPIEVCQGYIFDKLRTYLKANAFTWKNAKISGKLQDKVEQAFSNYAIAVGLPKSYITYTRFPFHFHKLLKWVHADYENRKNLCKTGWRSWQKYGNLSLEESTGCINKKNFFCLKCGKKIKARSPIKILRFYSNVENIIFVHRNCKA
ncbi:MAG: hypothetical protein GX759_07940 [Thermoanaerobacterales bacterium]|nr:hypothetical protein [Thermoanaerobacterales bacterium]